MIAAASALASRFAVATALDRIAPARVDERAPRRAVIECAHKKGTGSTKNGRDSNPQYLGVKKYGEEKVQVGSIIVRQRGNKFHAGDGVGTGKDFTLYALRDGEVKFKVGANKKKFVTVVDAVDRSGRADGQPTRKDKRKAMYSPRAVVREALENGTAAPTRTVVATRRSAAADAPAKAEKTAKAPAKAKAATTTVKKTLTKSGSAAAPKGFYRQVSKVRYCNLSLLLMDEAMEANGVLTEADVKRFHDHMLDGQGVTPTELATLEFVLNGGGGKYSYVVDDAAKAFLEATIAAERATLESEGGAR